MDISPYKAIIELRNLFEKSAQEAPLFQKSQGHLIPKKVQVYRNGKWFHTTRWVSPDIENPEDTTSLSKIAANDSLKTSEKIRALIDGGIYEARELMELSGAKYYSQAHTELKNKKIDVAALRAQSSGDFIVPTDIPDRPDFSEPEIQKVAIADLQKVSQTKAFEAQKTLKLELSKKFGITVQDKWDTYEFKIHQILQTGYPKALLAYGTGGVGKTYTLDKALSELELRPFDDMIHANSVGETGQQYDDDGEEIQRYDNYDYVKITGSTGKRSIHEALYYNRDKIIVFDDCDSMWEDDELMNVLKGALDTSGDGTISFKQDLKVGEGEKIPKRFKFEGRVIFISNYSRQDFIKAGASPIVDSRASAIDLSMTADQTLDRMEQIAPHVSIKNNKGLKMAIEPTDRANAIKMLREVKDYVRVEQLNGRTLGQLIALSAELTRQGKFSEEQYVRQSLISLDLV